MLSLQLCTMTDENVWTLKHTSFIKIPVRHNEVPIGKTAKSSIRIFRVEGFFYFGPAWSFLDAAVLSDPQNPKGEGHVIERETDHQGDAGSDRINLERYGADRTGRVLVAHILYPICVRSADGGSRDVVWYFGRASAVFGDGYCVRGTLETLSWSGFVIFFRRAGVS